MNVKSSKNWAQPWISKRLKALAVTSMCACGLLLNPAVAQAQPVSNAPTPTQSAGGVTSMFNSSGTYSDSPGIGWYASWSGASYLADYPIPSAATVKSYRGLSYAGVEFYGNPIDASSKLFMHLDVWTTANQLAVKLVSTAGAHGNQAAEIYRPASGGAVSSNQWVGLDIPLADFISANPLLDLSKLDQMLWIDNGDLAGPGVRFGDFYFDNVYFYTPTMPLTVAVTSPANGDVVNTNYLISASAVVSPGSIFNVAFYDGNTLLGNATSSPYSYSVVGASTGAHALKAVAQDSYGNSVTSSVVNVTVSSPTLILVPDGNFDSPSGDGVTNYWDTSSFGAPFANSFPTSGGNPGGYGVMDDTGGGSYGVWVSGKTAPLPLDSLSLIAGHTYNFVQDMQIISGSSIGGLKIESWGPGGRLSDSGDMRPASGSGSWETYCFSYTINAAATGIKFVPLWGPGSSVAFDNVGVMVPKTPIMASITSPAGGATVNTNFTVVGSAIVNPGSVTNMSFYVDNALAGVSKTYPFTFTSGNTTLSGAHSLKVVAKDSSGNSATSSVVNITIVAAAQPLPNYPIDNAPTPSRPSAGVVSLYNSSHYYTNAPVNAWATPWSYPSGLGIDYTNPVTGRIVKKYATLQYAGIDLPALNIGNSTVLHVDVWSPDATEFSVQFSGKNVSYTNFISPGQFVNKHWISLDFPLSYFPAFDKSNTSLFLFVDNDPLIENATFYIDNVYFWTTNQVQARISSGKQIGWTPSSGNSYQAQKSSNNSTWVNLGPIVTDTTVSNVYDSVPAAFYRVQEINPGALESIANSGFESDDGAGGTLSWTSVGSTAAVRNSSDVHSGSWSLDLNATNYPSSPSGVVLQQGFDAVTGGATYSFSAWSKLVSSGITFSPFCLVQWFDAATGFLSQNQLNLSTVPGVWTQSSLSVVAPATAVKAQIQIVANLGAVANDFGDMLVDDISLATGGGASTNLIAAKVSPGVGISWNSGVGRTYSVQTHSSLSAGSPWAGYGPLVTGTGTNTVSDSVSGTNQFYRVLEVY